jgi:hypothetical protein
VEQPESVEQAADEIARWLIEEARLTSAPLDLIDGLDGSGCILGARESSEAESQCGLGGQLCGYLSVDQHELVLDRWHVPRREDLLERGERRADQERLRQGHGAEAIAHGVDRGALVCVGVDEQPLGAVALVAVA